MKLVNSNKRYSSIIAGILVFVLLSIFMAFLIGCWGNAINEQNGFQTSFNGSFITPDCGDINHEPVPKIREWVGLDTATGSLTVDDFTFRDGSNAVVVDIDGPAPKGEFPLCIGLDQGYYFEIIVDSCGGYHPCMIGDLEGDGGCCGHYITLWQDGCFNQYRISLDINDPNNWVPTTDPSACECGTVWKGTFAVEVCKVEKKTSPCTWEKWDTCIKLFSNHPPCDMNTYWGKWVNVKINSVWCGCNLPSQCFLCCAEYNGLDTACGTFYMILDLPWVEGSSIYDSAYVFPLCIKDADVSLWGITVTVTGCYYPGVSYLTIFQEKVTQVSQFPENIEIVWDAGVLVDDTCPCLGMVYTGTFNVDDSLDLLDEQTGEPIPGTGMIKLDSNHIPCGIGPADLDKWVSVDFSTTWHGCASQTFEELLVHKIDVSGVPNTR
ncbi:MAG: hypothetical protein ACFE9J_07975 [Candidatus Hermodarchaeota archaeon]